MCKLSQINPLVPLLSLFIFSINIIVRISTILVFANDKVSFGLSLFRYLSFFISVPVNLFSVDL